VVHVDRDQVKKSGEKSTLSNGQLKQAIEQRIVIAKFLDKDEKWHCLFVTHDSLRGEENRKNGQPHFPYILSNFGLSIEKVVKSLKSRLSSDPRVFPTKPCPHAATSAPLPPFHYGPRSK